MGKILTNFNISLLMALAFSMPALAADKAPLLPLPNTLEYEFTYLEAPIGQATLRYKQGEKLSADGLVQVSGVARLFSDFYSKLTLKVDGSEPRAHARTFDTRYDKGDKKDQSYMKLTYDASGALNDIYREGVYDMERRDAIADDVLAESLDPLSTFVELRSALYQAVQDGTPKVSLLMYDGKRLYQLDAVIYGTRLHEWRGGNVSVQKVGLTHKPIGGLKDKEKKRLAEYQFPEAVLYFTADDKFLPIYGKQNFKFGAFKVRLK